MADLRTRLLELMAPLSLGEELSPGISLSDASTELGLRLTFAFRGEPVHVEIAPADEPGPFAAKSQLLRFAYRSGGLLALPPGLGLALCRTVAEKAALNEVRVLQAITDDARLWKDGTHEGARIREVLVDRILEPAGHGDQKFFTVSPYVGCLIGCRFCYAQSRVGLVRRLEGLPPVPWGSYVDVRVNAAEVLRHELQSAALLPIKFCPIVSDPYQAVERKHRVTRSLLTVLRDDGRFPVMVLTRSKLILEDAELIANIPLAHAGVSLPTIDDEVRRHFEPRGARVEERIETLRALRKWGVKTFAIVQPLLPCDLERFADTLAEHASSVSIDVLYGVEGAEQEFSDSRWSFARNPTWQVERALALRELLAVRGVAVWQGELPPSLILPT